jgi:GNAT superfamily N-acetyltransferase
MLNLVLADQKQLPEIAKMAREIWMEYYPAIISIEQIEYMLQKFYSNEALIEQTNQGHKFYFIEFGGNVSGFISVSGDQETEYFIHKFYIYSNLQGKNIGTQAFDKLTYLISKISKSNKINLKLTVNRFNYKAINFYFKNGFIIEQVEDFDIGNDFIMNDFIMKKVINFNKNDY